MSNQLVKKNPAEGYQNIFPKTWIDAIKDKESGVSLQEILQGFNMYFLSYNGSRALTRCKIPTILRKEGLWITYVLYDHTVVTEWYNSDQIDDNSWSMDSNWRVASNALVGDVSVSADGYWVINGEKTEAKAQGEQGVTPLLRVGANNKLQVSYNAGKVWKDISDYIVSRFRYTKGTTNDTAGIIQISMDLGKTWTNLSNEITNNLRISRYIGINESLPTSGVAEGTIYMKGPYYNESDTSNTNPIYRMWVYAWKGDTLAWQDNGEFTSISTSVVQERGNSTTEVMSQDAVTRELIELGQKLYETEQVDGTQIGTLSNGYLDENGNPQSNANYRRRVIPNDEYISLTGHGSSVKDMYVIAFYNSATISSSTLISGVKATMDYKDHDFDIRVPEGTMAIVVVYTTYSSSTPAEITLYKARLATYILQEEIDTLSLGVDYALSNDISKYSKDGYLKADGGWDNDNTIKSIDKIPVKNGDILLLTGFTDVTGMFLSRLMLEDGTTLSIYPSPPLVENLGGGDYRVTMPTEYNIQYATIPWLATLTNVGVYKVQTTEIQSNWEGKIWVGFGDSLTAQSSSYVGLSWSPKVEAKTGLEFKNCGIGSTCLAGNGANAFWKRLSTVEEYNPDVVTILGGANDLAYNIPIGTSAEYTKPINDKDTNSFKGAYSYIIETLLTWKASLRIVIMTTAFGDNNDGYKEYADACKDVANYYGLPCVDLYGNMGLNKLTSSIYTSDNLHWNAAGSQIVASLLISKLNEINNA